MQPEMRVGIGFDVHRFASDRRLILGGVHIPYARGLEGHSDADVLIHALVDALLGAVGSGDIGHHFPDSNPRYRGIDSTEILAHTAGILARSNAEVIWLDAVVIAEEPRMLPHVPAMRNRIGEILSLDPSRISIKGKTTEGLGFTGRKEGIAVQVAATVAVHPPGTE